MVTALSKGALTGPYAQNPSKRKPSGATADGRAPPPCRGVQMLAAGSPGTGWRRVSPLSQCGRGNRRTHPLRAHPVGDRALRAGRRVGRARGRDLGSHRRQARAGQGQAAQRPGGRARRPAEGPGGLVPRGGAGGPGGTGGRAATALGAAQPVGAAGGRAGTGGAVVSRSHEATPAPTTPLDVMGALPRWFTGASWAAWRTLLAT